MTKEEKRSIEDAKRKSAKMLLNAYVSEHTTEISEAFSKLIPFFNECNIAALRSYISTVNVTIATVALEVIKAKVETDNAYDALSLPVDANEIQDSIYYLTRFVEESHILATMLDNGDDPAIKMAREAYAKEQIV